MRRTLRPMPEISHVRISVPEQGMLNRVLREGGAQLFPQWLYAEPGDEPRIEWWGVRAAPVQMLDVPAADDPRHGLFPRPIDDWTEAPRGLVLVTADARSGRGRPGARSAPRGTRPGRTRSWAPTAGVSPWDAASSCWRSRPARDTRPPASTDSARGRGRGPRRDDGLGTPASTNPVSLGPATYVHLGPGTAPWLIFLPAR
jgi:hypothetical protein